MEPAWLAEIAPATSPPFVRMGTRALGGDPWLLGGDDVPAQLDEKRRILAAHHDEVVAALDATEDAGAELLETVRRALALAEPGDPTGPPPALPGHEADPVPPTADRTTSPTQPAPPDPRPPHGREGDLVPPTADRTTRPTQPAPPDPRPPHGREGDLVPPAADRTTRPTHPATPHPHRLQELTANAVPPGPHRPKGHEGGRASPGSATAVPAAEGGERPGGGGLHPIEVAARMVAEDLCLLVPGGGRWVLAAGSVCFPSHWRITEKLGLPLAAVHGPVPDYAAELADRVDRFLDKLRAGRGVVRRNWTVHTSPDLFAPDVPPPPDPPVTAAEAGRRLWLRSERQTLVRLPQTGAIVFTIRTQQTRLAAVAARPELRARLAEAVAAWPPHQVAYRGGEAVRRPLLAWLRAADAAG